MNIGKPMKMILSVSTLCAVMVFSNIEGAHASVVDMSSGENKFHQKGKNMMKRMVKVLSLSEDQQVKIKAIKMQAKEQGRTFRDSMKQFKGAEKQILQAKLFDEKAYRTLHIAYQQTFVEIALNRTKTKHAIFNVLTEEQQKKWLKKMKKRQGRLNN
jgi:Spy/CpxP family protein refolding chaperone